MSPVILSVDTSGMCGTIALRRDGKPVAERELEQSRRRHAQTLISEIQQLLKANQLAPNDVELVAVSHGPGSFTGLRVGIVFAKTFSYVVGCPIVAVDTLQAVAAAVTGEAFRDVTELHVVSDAQREQLFVSRFQRQPDEWWKSAGPIEIVDYEAWCDEAAGKASAAFAVSGTGLPKVVDDLASSVCRVPEDMWIPRAAQVAALAERQAEAGQFADPFELEPFYLRKSSAEEKREAKLAAEAAEQD